MYRAYQRKRRKCGGREKGRGEREEEEDDEAVHIQEGIAAKVTNTIMSVTRFNILTTW